MTITGLIKNNPQRFREFPITAHKIFLAHAAASPLPRRVSAAMQAYLRDASTQGQWEFLFRETDAEARNLAAALLKAGEDEIAFVSSTSMGLSLVAAGLTWNKGDNVVIADGDFPSNIYPWLNLERLGVTVKFIPRNKFGSVTLENVKSACDTHTRLVSLSTVSYVTGFKLNEVEIGRYLHDNGILFCLDAVQSLGVLPVDITYVDFLAASAHKWLLGPIGIGILYVKNTHHESLRSVLSGWKCVEHNHDYLDYGHPLQCSARRYEPSNLSIVGITGLHAALSLLLEAGTERVSDRLSQFRNMIIPALREKGYVVLSPQGSEEGSGIISFNSPVHDIDKIRNTLDDNGCVVSLREDLTGGKCVRVAPHFYNTEDEIERFLDMLP